MGVLSAIKRLWDEAELEAEGLPAPTAPTAAVAVAEKKPLVTPLDIEALVNSESAASATMAKLLAEIQPQLARARADYDQLVRVPEMHAQRQTVSNTVSSLVAKQERLERSLRLHLRADAAGYAEFEPRLDWAWGFLSAPGFSRSVQYNLFHSPLPDEAITKLEQAKKLELFEHFTVHSPNGELFTTYTPPTRAIDPILVGWIGEPWRYDWRGMSFSTDHRVLELNTSGVRLGAGVTGYLIAQWDIAGDLEHNKE